MTNVTFKLIRLHVGMSQAAFAEYIGVSKATVSLIELGQRRVTPNTIAKLAHRFELNDAFFAYVENYLAFSQLNNRTSYYVKSSVLREVSE